MSSTDTHDREKTQDQAIHNTVLFQTNARLSSAATS